MNKEIVNQVNELWNQYKLPSLAENCSIISADFGHLGSINIKEILSFEKPVTFKYESGAYDFISICASSIKDILWTDYQDIEPYNRTSGLYCNGASFKSLGPAILETPLYRTFVKKHENMKQNIMFGVWGFDHNKFYNTISFGMCIKNEDVDTFMEQLLKIIEK